MSIITFKKLQSMVRSDSSRYRLLTQSIKSYKEQLAQANISAQLRCSLKIKLNNATKELAELKITLDEEAEYLMFIDLEVPYEDKDIVKFMGAKWDWELKTWYIDITEVDMDRFTEFMPKITYPKKEQPKISFANDESHNLGVYRLQELFNQ